MIFKLLITNIFGQSFTAISSDFPKDEFATIEAWKQHQIQINAWGKPERWVTDVAEDVTGHLEIRQIPIGDGTQFITEYRMPAQYEITEQDITAEIVAESKRAKEDIKKQFGSVFMLWMKSLNEAGGITPQQVIAMRADPRVSMANDLALGGDIPTLLYHIQNTDWTGLFPESVKTAAIQKIQAFIAENPS